MSRLLIQAMRLNCSRDRAKITSPNLFIKTLKTLGILQTECDLILTRSLKILIPAVVVLSGCLGTHPVTPTRYYLLNPVEYDSPLVPAGSVAPLSVEIAALHLPQYLEKPQIVTRTSRNRLVMDEYRQWGGNLRKNMMRVLSQNLSRLLDTAHVAMVPFRPPVPSDFRIEAEVMRFEADEKGRPWLTVHWRLSRGADGRTLATEVTVLKGPDPGESYSMEEIVSGMEWLWGEFAAILGREILARGNAR